MTSTKINPKAPPSDASKKNEYKTDLKKLRKFQLTEILERQKKLASNKKALCRLPDQGQKILDYLKQIEDELDRREKECDIAEAFAGLTLTQLNRLEWIKDMKNTVEETPDGVEEDETNPLKILATHSGAGYHKKEIKEEPKEQSLVTERDIEDLYALNLCNKLDKIEPKEKFRPYKTLNHAKLSTGKERDLSAATPPISKFGDTKLVGLEDSLRLLMTQNDLLRDIQMQHAADRLRDKTYALGEVLPTGESVRLYRETVDPDEELEVQDECEGHDGGDVRFPIDFDEVD